MNKTEEILLKYVDMLMDTNGSLNSVYSVLSEAEPIVVANLASLFHGFNSVLASAYNKLCMTQTPTVELKRSDWKNVMHQTGKNILSIYRKSRPDVYKVRIESSKWVVSKQCRHGYAGTVYSRCGNAKARSALMHYRASDISALRSFVGQLRENIAEFIATEAVEHELAKQMEAHYRVYVHYWNESPTIMKLRPNVCVDLGYNLMYGHLLLQLWTIYGKKIKIVMRNINSWIIDGSLTEPFGEFYAILKIEEWRTIYKNPSKWLTLDNYRMFNDEHTHIEEVTPAELGGATNIRALRIKFSNTEDYDAKYVFFKERDGQFEFVNTNQKEANMFLKRLELFKELSS